MKNDMSVIMENWNKNVLQENKVLFIHEELINEFVLELKTLTERKAELNEILSKIGDFAKKAYNTYSEVKKGTIKKVLETAINGALKIIPLIKEKVPNVASKIERILNELKKDENMTLAISIVSIIIGLMTGEAFDAIGEILDIIDSAPNIIKAYEMIANVTDSADVVKVADKSGQLVNVASMAQ